MKSKTEAHSLPAQDGFGERKMFSPGAQTLRRVRVDNFALPRMQD